MYIFKKRIEFTKILSAVIMLIYLFFVYVSIFSYIKTGSYVEIVLDYSKKLFTVLVPSYLLKSSIQNYDKITNSTNDDNKKTITFSKTIVILMFISLIVSTAILYYNYSKTGIFAEQIFKEITSPFTLILPSYVVKAAVENKATSKTE